MNWLSYNWQWAGDLAATHLYLSASAVVIAVLVAVPLGRLAFRFPKLGGALLSAATLIYAVPFGRIRLSDVCTCVCVPTTALTRPSRK